MSKGAPQALSHAAAARAEGSDPGETLLAVFKAYLDDLGRLGGRHETARQFYLSVISALFVFLSLTGSTGPLVSFRGAARILVGIVGMLLCFLWAAHMHSFGLLFEAKLAQLRSLETELRLPAKPFTNDAEALKAAHYVHITSLDMGVAIALSILFLLLMFFKAQGL